MIDELASHLLPGVPVERVAAALGAAAEHGRADGGFERLGKLPATLGGGGIAGKQGEAFEVTDLVAALGGA